MLKGIGKGIDLEDLETAARARLPESTYRRIAGGSQDQVTLARNREAWTRIALAPHILRGTPSPDTATSVLGAAVSTPVFIAPAGLAAYATHPEAEKAVARAAAAAGTLMALSTYAAVTLEEVAAAAPGGLRWFQIYLQQDRGWSAELLQRARVAGYRAIVFTVDAGDGMPGALAALRRMPPMIRSEFEPALRLSDIEWIKHHSGLPVVVKGVLRPDDAADCVAAGADAIVVSNHGGRMMDTAATTAEVLPGIVEAVGHRTEIYVDSGIRRGHDVLKAIALGARAAFIGRPWIWGLVADGADGVQGVVEQLTRELSTTMHLCGAARIADVTRDLLFTPPR